MVGLSHLASVDQNGRAISRPKFPFQLFLVPAQKVTVSCTNYVRDLANFSKLRVGSTLFNVYAMEIPTATRKKIGTMQVNGKFTTSKFGDTRLFFKHAHMEDDFKVNPSWTKQGVLATDK